MASPVRRPYTGSCHCGATKYVLWLTMPHKTVWLKMGHKTVGLGQSFYRCNCTVCHKSGIFHTRLNSAVDDFLLLSPTDPNDGVTLGDYRCRTGQIQFFFCRTCGGRCFQVRGEGETLPEVDLKALGVGDEALKRLGVEGDGKVPAWRPKKGVSSEKPLTEEERQQGKVRSYLSINGFTLDPFQEGLDLREITEKKWVSYSDALTEDHKHSSKRPCIGGAY